MTTPRRRIIRSAPPTSQSDPQRTSRLEKLRSRREQERAALVRWMARLKRAFHRVEAQQKIVARLEKQIARMED